MSLPETTLPGPNQIAQITLKPKIHTSQLIATVNQKINLEVMVLEVTHHQLIQRQEICKHITFETHHQIVRIL